MLEAFWVVVAHDETLVKPRLLDALFHFIRRASHRPIAEHDSCAAHAAHAIHLATPRANATRFQHLRIIHQLSADAGPQ